MTAIGAELPMQLPGNYAGTCPIADLSPSNLPVGGVKETVRNAQSRASLPRNLDLEVLGLGTPA